MEDLTAVCFTAEPAEPAKKGIFGKWRFFVTAEELPAAGEAKEQGRMRKLTVHFPLRYRKRKDWTWEALAEYEAGLPIPPQSGTVCYLYENEIRSLLHRQQEPVSYPWLQGMLEYYKAAPDNLIILEDEDMGTEELIFRYVKKARTITVVSERVEELEELRESLSEEYGFLLYLWEKAGNLYIPARGNTVFAAGRRLYGLKPAQLPADSFFFSTERGEGQKLCRRAEGVRYVDAKIFMRDWEREARSKT